MKLNLMKITELEQRNEELRTLEADTVKKAKENYGRDFNQWYPVCRDLLSELHRKVEENEKEILIIKATNVEVGDGISLSPYTDWDAFTVIERRETPKGFVLTLQEDKAIRTDNNGRSESQSYRFEKDDNGRIVTIKWNPKKQWYSADGYKVALGRHAYYDYSF